MKTRSGKSTRRRIDDRPTADEEIFRIEKAIRNQSCLHASPLVPLSSPTPRHLPRSPTESTSPGP